MVDSVTEVCNTPTPTEPVVDTPTPTPTVTSPPSINDYLCRPVKDLKVPAAFVPINGAMMVDQTSNETCKIVKPKLICNPVSKDGSSIADPSLHYCCYLTRCTPTATGQVMYDIQDQFSTLRFQAKKPHLFCTACTKVPVP